MEDKEVKSNLLLKSLGFLFLPLIIFPFFSFLISPLRPHCSVGNGVLGCIPTCEPTSYFEDGRPASYKEIPCFHNSGQTIQSTFNEQWLIPLIILAILMVFIAILIYKKGFKSFLKNVIYIAFAPIFLSKENRRNKSIISRIFVIFVIVFLIIEWLSGYYIVLMTFMGK